ncbi:MAG: multicopper oxidase family protein, partial [Micromonosporaceae bacterium]
MTAAQAILLDHVVALLSVAAWLAAGVTAAVRRPRLARRLLAAAVLMTLARGVTVALLASRGWWFVQEKVLLGLPMLAVAGLVAVLVTGRVPKGTASVVSLFTAGYAALAGLGVTFLAGYPLTWSTALIAATCVGLGALLTARVVATPVEDPARAGAADAVPTRGVSRRRFLGWAGGAAVLGTGGTGAGLLLMPAASVATGGGPGRSSGSPRAVSVADLRGAEAPAPGGTTRRYTLTARQATVGLPSGREVDAWTYDGRMPGPAITATEGDLVEVTLRNTDIQDGVTVHWHGYDVPCGEDGAPGLTQHVVAPGAEFGYRFRADQVGTYWYHTHQASHPGVRKGLYGTLVVTPRDADAAQLDLTLPVHTFDGTVVIAGRDGRTDHTARAGTPVRLRLINTDSDPHRFALSGTPFRVAAVDGRDLHRPGELREVALRLPAGGRYDLVFTMPDAAVALVV